MPGPACAHLRATRATPFPPHLSDCRIPSKMRTPGGVGGTAGCTARVPIRPGCPGALPPADDPSASSPMSPEGLSQYSSEDSVHGSRGRKKSSAIAPATRPAAALSKISAKRSPPWVPPSPSTSSSREPPSPSLPALQDPAPPANISSLSTSLLSVDCRSSPGWGPNAPGTSPGSRTSTHDLLHSAPAPSARSASSRALRGARRDERPHPVGAVAGRG